MTCTLGHALSNAAAKPFKGAQSLAISVFPLCYLKQLNTQRWLSLGNQFIRIVFSKKRGARDGVTRETQFLAASRLTLASRTRRGITQMRLGSV